MKNIFFCLLVFLSVFANAQTQQNINKNTGTTSNPITTIDSIRFNGSSTIMEVVLQNGTTDSHSISEIINVNFVSASNHSCGADSVHNPNLTYGSMIDQDGNVYKTIVIGTQEWMAENLNTRTYRNGDTITNAVDINQWTNLSVGAWCYHDNNSQRECPFGKLYNWYAVADPRNVCPMGWHVPSNEEWTTLTDFLGGEAIAGGKMKSTGIQYWLNPNGSATNESGFSGLPGRGRYDDGSFEPLGYDGYWWSTSEYASSLSFRHYLLYTNSYMDQDVMNKRCGFSVRCIRD
jgi:uncharacterized protein (TIGR02145 family)